MIIVPSSQYCSELNEPIYATHRKGSVNGSLYYYNEDSPSWVLGWLGWRWEVKGGPDGYSQPWRQSCSQIEMSYCGEWALGLGPPDGREGSLSFTQGGRRVDKQDLLCSNASSALTRRMALGQHWPLGLRFLYVHKGETEVPKMAL